MELKSSKVLSFDVVNLSHRMGRSSLWMESAHERFHIKPVYGDPTDVDAVSIVSNLQQLQAPIFHHNLQGSRASIDSVLDQLFESMYRCDYNFTSSDLVHDILIESLD